MADTKILLGGLCFAEGPRWRNDKLYFSDMHANIVYTVDSSGELETVVALDNDQPSGLGWLPDGRLLIVSMTERKVLAYDGSVLSELADLSSLASYHCNDMVTDPLGRSYVGNFGFNLHKGSDFKKAEVIMVESDGRSSVVAEELAFPNGMVITPDGSTLIVAETMAARLTAFDIDLEGNLTHRRIWAKLDEAMPDGICLDSAGGIWVASPSTNEAMRVEEGGKVTDRVRVGNRAFACMLGGDNGITLHILTSRTSDPETCALEKSAAIEIIDVSYPGAGWP